MLRDNQIMDKQKADADGINEAASPESQLLSATRVRENSGNNLMKITLIIVDGDVASRDKNVHRRAFQMMMLLARSRVY